MAILGGMSLASWFGTLWQVVRKAMGVGAGAGPVRDPRPYLTGSVPGLWHGNHMQEALSCKGWQFVAVRALSRMSSQAEATLHEVIAPAAEARSLTRAAARARRRGEPSRHARL